MAILSLVAAGCFATIITSPARVIVPWDEGQCMWLNGTVVNKSAEIEDDGFHYKFHVVGEVDNNTSFNAVVLGSRFDYLFIPIGATYEGQICDTVPLRTAVLNGTIRFVDWVIH